MLVHHIRDEEVAYDWFSFVPPNLNKGRAHRILVAGAHGNVPSDNYEKIIEESKKQAEWKMETARDLQVMLLVPVVPTSPRYEYYPVAFDRPSLHESTQPFYRRADLEVNKMIDLFTSVLRSDGYNVPHEVLIEGFSTGGMFAQRYALLHPDRVQAIAAGHCGGVITLPETSYNGVTLYWPLGIADYEILLRRPFDMDAYRDIPQLLYIGERDDRITLDGLQVLGVSDEERSFVFESFGQTPPEILSRQTSHLSGIGYDNITFRVYSDTGHEITSKMWSDVLSFLRAHRN